MYGDKMLQINNKWKRQMWKMDEKEKAKDCLVRLESH